MADYHYALELGFVPEWAKWPVSRLETSLGSMITHHSGRRGNTAGAANWLNIARELEAAVRLAWPHI